MASVVIYGDTSGQIDVKATAVAGSTTITLPASTITADQVPLATSTTGALPLTLGTSDQRPTSLATGQLRMNTTNNTPEYYNGTGWVSFSGTNQYYSVSYLVVAGGGGGGSSRDTPAGGGGGAGGMQSSTATLTKGNAYSIIIGAGGAGASTPTNGSDSIISGTGLTTITSIAGGKGAA